MFSLELVAAALCAIFCVGFLYAEHAQSNLGRWIAKPLASIFFVVAGIAADGSMTPTGRLILAGLVLGACGDVLLLPHNKAAFLAGIGVFLLGHVAYAAAFLSAGSDLLLASATLAPLAIVAYFIGRWLLPHVEAPMKAPVLAYIAVISLMVALAVGTYSARTGSAPWLIAAIAFYLSDLSVARDRFVSPGLINRVWGIPLYYAAQLLFALTAAG